MAASTSPPSVDYTLYLVTDVTKAILGTKSLVNQVRQACAGGATIVQHRDKTSSTATLINDGRALHKVTKQYGVPLLINDRLDVALAVGCEGVHLGQDDMDLATARQLLGPSKLIGITVSNVTEAEAAIAGGADYVGIGTMFGTPTKIDTKEIIGTTGTQRVLAAVSAAEVTQKRKVGAVAIGGINRRNVQRVVYQSASQQPPRALDGVAVVSALMASDDATQSAGELRRLIAGAEQAPFATLVYPPDVAAADLLEAYLGRDIAPLFGRVRQTKPLCHNMTNLVVQNFAANVALAVGGSPIMANDGSEATDLAKLGGSLVVNMGSATPGAVEHASKAMSAYNAAGGPVLFDPVGGGATQIRRDAVRSLLAAGYMDVIKGNESEIVAVAEATGIDTSSISSSATQQQRGVDAADSGRTIQQKAELARHLAEQRRCIVLMTGGTDLLSDGERVLAVHNGCALLGQITGSGCALGTTIGAFLAVEKQDKLLATLAAVLLYEVAAEQAIEQSTDSVGPGSFVPRFIDQLATLSNMNNSDSSSGDGAKGEQQLTTLLAKRARVEPVYLQTQVNGSGGGEVARSAA